MQKHIYYISAALMIGILTVHPVFAKVWLLPDYQARQLYANRSNSPEKGQNSSDNGGLSCRDYGMISAAEIGAGMVCQNTSRIQDLVCYSGCSCSSEYQYTESSCRSAGKIASGSSCDGKYAECICDTSLYPHTSSSCVPSLSGASCTDGAGTHYENCETDPCAGKEIVSCGKALGCAETCDADGTQCIRCNEQPDCGDGEYWFDDDLGCVINTCPVDYAADDPLDCGLRIANSNWIFDYDNIKQIGTLTCYKCILECDTGHEFNSSGTSCVASACPRGYATAASGCGTAPTHGYWDLGSTTNGYSGTSACKNCTRKCNDGYTLSGTSCVVAACEGNYATELSKCPYTDILDKAISLDCSQKNGKSGEQDCCFCKHRGPVNCPSGAVCETTTIGSGSSLNRLPNT